MQPYALYFRFIYSFDYLLLRFTLTTFPDYHSMTSLSSDCLPQCNLILSTSDLYNLVTAPSSDFLPHAHTITT